MTMTIVDDKPADPQAQRRRQLWRDLAKIHLQAQKAELTLAMRQRLDRLGEELNELG